MASLTGSITLTDFHTGLGINWLGELESSSSITNPKENDIYYNTTDKITYIYHKGDWEKLSAEGSGIDIYELQFNNSEILKYTTLAEETDDNSIYAATYYPEKLTIKAVKKTDGADKTLSKDEYDLLFYDSQNPTSVFNIKNILTSEDNKINSEGGSVESNLYISYNVDNDSYVINISALSTAEYDSIIEKPDDEIATSWREVLNLALNTTRTATLIFKLFIGGQEENLYPLIIRNPSSEELMAFSIYAGNIVAAIQDKKMDFSANGLKIFNTGFSIEVDKKGDDGQFYSERVFNVEKNDDGSADLVMRGKIYATDGEFGGALNAATGTFSGTLKAADGEFEGKIKATDSEFTGKVIATSGEFRGDVLIEKSVELEPNSVNFIYLSAEGNNSGIYQGTKTTKIVDGNLEEISSSSNFSVDLEGNVIANSIKLQTGSIGDIKFDNSKIWAGSLEEPPVWEINPDKAIFNNVEIKGKISTAIFEQEKSQLCGGSFLFKDGLSIRYKGSDDFNKTNISIEQGAFVKNHLYLFSTESGEGQFYALYDEDKWSTDYAINQSKDIEYTLALDLGELKKKTIPLEGSEETITSLSLADCFIGINSTGTAAVNGLSSNSLTISETVPILTTAASGDEKQKIECSIEPRVILGKLGGDKGYGLYADNVFLNGTLSTHYKNNNEINYAGINTISEVTFIKDSATKEETRDVSPIIIWAGAANETNGAIQSSKFQVSANGTLYAQKALIENSILAGADVTAEILRAKVVCGIEEKGEEPKAALKIYDPDTGIAFYGTNYSYGMSAEQEEESLVFEVKSDSVNSYAPIKGKSYLGDSKEITDFYGNLKGSEVKIDDIVLKNNGINFYNSSELYYTLKLANENLCITRNSEKLVEVGINETKTRNDATFYKSQIYKYVTDGKEKIIATYAQAKNTSGISCGIDLFISEEI